MAYNTKEIVKDKDGNPISQYYNKDLDKYEPVEGSGGGNKVVLYNEDGSENNSLSLIPILDKLSQLTGTVIDEETRKSNQLQRIAFFEMLQKMLADGELKGEQGIQGIQGETGKGLEFYWRGTELGVRIKGDLNYVYMDLKGETGNIENLNSTHIIEALGYTPADTNLIGLLTSLTTEQKNNLVDAINEMNANLATRVKKTGDSISGTLGVGMRYNNLLSIYVAKVLSNGLKIKTNISVASRYRPMVTLIIEGYDYYNTRPLLLYISFYYYGATNDFQIINMGASSINEYKPEIKIGFEEGRIVVWLADYSNFNTYTIGAILVQDSVGTLPPSETIQGWNIVGESLSPSVEGLIAVPYKD